MRWVLVSMPFHVLSSVPQSSHLGALLFNLWMNDICGIIFVIFLMSVDDMKVFYRIQLYLIACTCNVLLQILMSGALRIPWSSMYLNVLRFPCSLAHKHNSLHFIPWTTLSRKESTNSRTFEKSSYPPYRLLSTSVLSLQESTPCLDLSLDVLRTWHLFRLWRSCSNLWCDPYPGILFGHMVSLSAESYR